MFFWKVHFSPTVGRGFDTGEIGVHYRGGQTNYELLTQMHDVKSMQPQHGEGNQVWYSYKSGDLACEGAKI